MNLHTKRRIDQLEAQQQPQKQRNVMIIAQEPNGYSINGTFYTPAEFEAFAAERPGTEFICIVGVKNDDES